MNPFPHPAEDKGRNRKKVAVLLLCIVVILTGAGVGYALYRNSTQPKEGKDTSLTGEHKDDSVAGWDANQGDDNQPVSSDDDDTSTDSSSEGGWLGWLFGGNSSTVSLANASTTGKKGATQTLDILKEFEPSAGARFDLSTIELRLVSNPVAGSILSQDKKMVTTPGEGKYNVQGSSIRFSPVSSFVGEARGVGYQVKDTAGVTFTSVYEPVVKKPATLEPQPAVCNDPSSQGLALHTIQGRFEYEEDAEYAGMGMKQSWMEFYGTAVEGNGDYVYATDSNEYLYRSTDKGQSWKDVSPTMDTAIESVDSAFLSSDKARLYAKVSQREGNDSRYVVSTTKGNTWSQLNLPGVGADLYSLTDDGQRQVAYIYSWQTNEGTVYVSDNVGQTWTEMNLPAGMQSFRSAVFSNDHQTLYVLGVASDTYKGTIYRSTDEGASWDIIDPDPAHDYQLANGTLMVSGNGRLVLTGYDIESYNNMMLVSTDEGGTWSTIEFDPDLNLSEPKFSSNGSTVLARGMDGETYNDTLNISRDSGATWTTVQLPQGVEYLSGYWISPDGTQIWYGGESSSGLTNNDGNTWMQFKNTSSQQFKQNRIDLDPSKPGQQLVLDRRASKGWIVSYDPSEDRLIPLVSDPVKFPKPQDLVLSYTLMPSAGCANPIPGKILLEWQDYS